MRLPACAFDGAGVHHPQGVFGISEKVGSLIYFCPDAGGVDDGVVVVPGAGVAGGVVAAGAGWDTGGAGVPPTTELGPRWPMIASISAPSMNSTARIAVAFDSTVAPERAPNAD